MQVIDTLRVAAGTWLGSSGVNHEDEAFDAELVVAIVAGGHGVSLTFRATATADPTLLLHDEHALVGPNRDGGVSYVPLSTNIPFLLPHELVREDGTTFVFGSGDPASGDEFREQITIAVTEHQIAYGYAWGLPGGEFAERSAVILERSPRSA